VSSKQYVEREFGTGALKITPGHDPNDYAIGKKLDLPIINIMNNDGTLNDRAGVYWYTLIPWSFQPVNSNLWMTMSQLLLSQVLMHRSPCFFPPWLQWTRPIWGTKTAMGWSGKGRSGNQGRPLHNAGTQVPTRQRGTCCFKIFVDVNVLLLLLLLTQLQ